MSTLTAGADLAWKLAASEATAGGHPLIENALLLVGILSLETIDETPAPRALAADVRRAVEDEARGVAEVLARCGLEAASLRRLLRDLAGRGGRERRSRTVSRSPACRETFYRAAMLSGPAGVSALDLMAALGEAPDAVVARALREGGTSVERLREEARRAERERRAARAAGRAGAPGADPAATRLPGESQVEAGDAATPGLDRYGRDLTALAARGELGPVIGRRAELLQVLQILARAGRNPVLVGEPGVGKTKVVEALAMRAAQGKDPAVLGGKRIVELRLPALLADTKDSAVLEERASRVLAEARSRPDLIVVLDELHMFVGAGETEGGGGNVGNPFKSGLARGGLRLIGATTTAGYREHIEPFPALARLFEAVPVDEPSREETLEILTGLRPRWESRHQVAIDDEALLAAIELSVRFDPDRNLPSKAIDLVDRAVARTRAPLLTMVRPPSSKEAPGESPPVSAGGAPDRVTERAVAQAQSERSRLPLDLVAEGLGGLRRPVLDVEPFLRERILGQDRAIARVGRRLRLALAGPRDPERPLATLLFLGPDGVGKTETARLAASFLFGTEQALHRLDHSAFTEEHLVSRLRTIPEAIVLLDEIEKAQPRALDLLVQLCSAGGLRDDKGRAADVRNAIFVFTSNLGSGEDRGRAAGPAPGATDGPGDDDALEAARRLFPPSFLNRIDEVIVFRALGLEDAVRILRLRLRALCETVERQHGVRLEVEREAEDFVARTGFDPACGVGELPRVVERLVEAPLSSLILDGKIRKHAAWRVAYDEGGIYVVPRGG